MKVFRCNYIPHTKEDHPEVLSYLFGYLTKDEAEAYHKHNAHSTEMGVAFLEKLLSNDVEDDRLYDEDIYYYIMEGSEEAENPALSQSSWGYASKHQGEPEFGDIYRGLVYDDDLMIVIKEVYES